MSQNRLSIQQQQEYRSRNQLADRFEEFGWIVDPIYKDLGEDFVVRIYDKGEWSGLLFLVQLKSTFGISRFLIRNNQISYSLKVKDLKHWGFSATPLLIVIWDLDTKIGYWVSVNQAIQQLEDKNPKWVDQKTVKVRIELQNDTSDMSLKNIRFGVANHFLPSIAKDKIFEIRAVFEFPQTPEGRKKFELLGDHFNKGDDVVVEGDFIKVLKFPEWWIRLFGEIDPKSTKMKLGPPRDQPSLPAKIEFYSQSRQTETFEYVALKKVKQGSEEITLSNEDQNSPVIYRITLHREEERFDMSTMIKNPGKNVIETRLLLGMLQILSEGGNCRVTFLDSGESLVSNSPPNIVEPPGDKFLDLFDKLVTIQEKTGVELSLSGDWDFDDDEINKALELDLIVVNGRFKEVLSQFEIPLNRAEIEQLIGSRDDEKVNFRLISKESQIEILEKTIELGPCTRYISGELGQSHDVISDYLLSFEPDEEVKMNLLNVNIVYEFNNWLPQ
jgi:hypothetical protein